MCILGQLTKFKALTDCCDDNIAALDHISH